MIKRIIIYSATVVPLAIFTGITLFLFFKFIFFLGQSNALAQIILSDPDLCVFKNTITAKAIAKANNVACVTVLINEKHVRYKIGDMIIDESCGEECDNMTYYSFTWCYYNNSMRLLDYKYLK